ASDVQSRCAGCPSPGTLFRETSLTAGFLLPGVWTLHRTCLVRGGESGTQHSLPHVATIKLPSGVNAKLTGLLSPSAMTVRTPCRLTRLAAQH
ncbi:hypothetical protein, partial [Yersinia alsatica]|uniref:hypothetical protein n=1 Tax=Yersinia alsatica TaxID=2890317 RepID=UPI001C9450BB